MCTFRNTCTCIELSVSYFAVHVTCIPYVLCKRNLLHVNSPALMTVNLNPTVSMYTCTFLSHCGCCYFSKPEWWAALIFSKPFVAVFMNFISHCGCLFVCCVC